jgi:hypothetical protein
MLSRFGVGNRNGHRELAEIGDCASALTMSFTGSREMSFSLGQSRPGRVSMPPLHAVTEWLKAGRPVVLVRAAGKSARSIREMDETRRLS